MRELKRAGERKRVESAENERQRLPSFLPLHEKWVGHPLLLRYACVVCRHISAPCVSVSVLVFFFLSLVLFLQLAYVCMYIYISTIMCISENVDVALNDSSRDH